MLSAVLFVGRAAPPLPEAAGMEPASDGGTAASDPAFPMTGMTEELLHPSRRCAECHARQREEWASSAHARAASSEPFLRTRAAAPNGPACDGCHVPLKGASERVASEGVGCDACHTATGLGENAQPLKLEPERVTRFGPYRDSEDHHFHRVAYSEFVTTGLLCESCHEDRQRGAVAIYTTATEWRQSASATIPCQTCHLETRHDEAAKGAGLRSVGAHDFGANKGKAVASALDVRFVLLQSPQGPVAQVDLGNSGGGHAIPTGLPERRLHLVVEGLDSAGRTVSTEERRWGRRLVDAGGRLVPFFRAVREDEDTRLQAGEVRRTQFPVAKGAASVRVRLLWERWDPALSRDFGEAEPVVVFEQIQRVRGS